MCIFVFALVVILKEILKAPSALGRFHGDLGFVGTCVKQEMGLTGVDGLGLMTYLFYHSR